MQLWSHALQPLFLTAALACVVSCGSQTSQTSTPSLPISTLPILPITASPVFLLHVSGPPLWIARAVVCASPR